MKTILVVDDAAFMRTNIRYLLEKYDYQVLEAEDVYEATKMYEKHRPDAVTMDIAMPGKSGIVGVAEIMKLDPDAKIVVITSMGTEFTIRDAINNGAKNFIIKPFTEKQLVDVIRSLDK